MNVATRSDVLRELKVDVSFDESRNAEIDIETGKLVVKDDVTINDIKRSLELLKARFRFAPITPGTKSDIRTAVQFIFICLADSGAIMVDAEIGHSLPSSACDPGAYGEKSGSNPNPCNIDHYLKLVDMLRRVPNDASEIKLGDGWSVGELHLHVSRILRSLVVYAQLVDHVSMLGPDDNWELVAVARYGNRVGGKLIAAIEREMRGKDFCDNVRFADVSKALEEIEYNIQKAHGCCGFEDKVIRLCGMVIRFGFNYGH